MIISFAYPSSRQRTGGVVVLYEFANHLAQRGHLVHFIHGPAWPDRIDDIDELTWAHFDPGVTHHIVDSLDDPNLPTGDLVNLVGAPPRLGLPFNVIQGFRMMSQEWEEQAFRFRGLKVCVASWLIDVGHQLGSPPEQLCHIPPGIDHALFTPPTDADRPIDLAMLHHPHREKGWDVGHAVLVEAHRRDPTLRSIVFGVTQPPEDLPPGARFLRAPDQRTLVDEVYGRTKVFVQTSHHEGLGLTAVEAMACGASLVTTDNGGSRDYALADRTAWVTSTGNVDGLLAGVEMLLTDPERRSRYVAAGLDTVRAFDWTLSAAKLEQHLGAYLDEPARFQRPPSEAQIRGGIR